MDVKKLGKKGRVLGYSPVDKLVGKKIRKKEGCKCIWRIIRPNNFNKARRITTIWTVGCKLKNVLGYKKHYVGYQEGYSAENAVFISER